MLLQFIGLKLFQPDECPAGLFGWQGIIPAKATKMARNTVRLLIDKKVVDLREIFARIEPSEVRARAPAARPALVPRARGRAPTRRRSRCPAPSLRRRRARASDRRRGDGLTNDPIPSLPSPRDPDASHSVGSALLPAARMRRSRSPRSRARRARRRADASEFARAMEPGLLPLLDHIVNATATAHLPTVWNRLPRSVRDEVRCASNGAAQKYCLLDSEEQTLLVTELPRRRRVTVLLST